MMKEMVYQKRDTENFLPHREVLCESSFGIYNYYVISHGVYPSVYVEIPYSHTLYENFDSFSVEMEIYSRLNAHGGITHIIDSLELENGERISGHFIGWDYNTDDDFYYLLDKPHEGEKWDLKKMIDDTKRICDELLFYDWWL